MNGSIALCMQFNLALMFEKGQGMEQSDEGAAMWFHRAAVQGFDRAQFNLAVMYEHGRGLERSPSLAAQWYVKAAMQGHSDAAGNLSILRRELNDEASQDPIPWYKRLFKAMKMKRFGKDDRDAQRVVPEA